jgi:hypothetical protein
MLPPKVTAGIAVFVSVIWAVNVIVGFWNPQLRDPLINGIFAVIVGTVFALRRKDSPPPTDQRDGE